MMNYQLLVPGLLDRASVYFPNKEIITREGDGAHRYTYRDLKGRVNRLCNALAGLGVGKGDRVGTFGWNTYRHLEAYFAPPTMGAVTHTTNIRLSADDLTYIVNHAGDKVMLVESRPRSHPGTAGPAAGERGAFRDNDRRFRVPNIPAVGPHLRGIDGCRIRQVRVAAVGRERPCGPVLHVGHHRTAQGRDVHSSRTDIARHDGMFRRRRRCPGAATW